MDLSKDEIVRREILLEAQKLFQQFGNKKTTMDEIAAACGKAKSTLYHYFKNKEEVFNAVLQMEMLNLRQHVKSKVEEFKHIKDKIRTYIIEFHKEVINKVNLYRIVKHEFFTESKAKTQFYKMLEYEKSYIIRILEDGFDSGEYTDVPKDEIPWVAEIFLAAFYGTVLYTVEKEGTFDEEKLVYAVDLFIPKIFVK